MSIRLLCAAVSMALLAAGCRAEAGGGNGDLEVIVPPGRDGELSPDLVVSCPSGPSFPVSALDEIPALHDADPGGVAEGIAPFLESEEGKFWPQDDWRILHETDEEILLVHPGSPGPSFIHVARTAEGWKWSGAQGGGPCPLQYRVPDGLNTVGWRLAGPPPEPGDTTVEVILNERDCVSGQEIGDRLVGPQIVITETTVHVAFAATPPEGEAFTCQGNPDTAYTVELPEPIGERTLVEGLSTGLDLGDFLP